LLTHFLSRLKKSIIDGKRVDKEDSNWNGKLYTETPFIKEIPGPKHSLIQTWPTKINDKFKKDFEMFDENPDTTKFEASAVTDWKQCMDNLFGEGATTKVPIQYCKKKTENQHSCYLVMTEELLAYLKKDKEAMNAVGIKEMTETGFLATGEDGKGNKIEKPFTMEPNQKYVVYKKQGWETMGCCKLHEQFVKECEFVGKGEKMDL